MLCKFSQHVRFVTMKRKQLVVYMSTLLMFTCLLSIASRHFYNFSNCSVYLGLIGTLKTQRVQLSQQLNHLQESYQQLKCLSRKQTFASETGGWCNKAIKSQHRTDENLIPALAKLFANKSVVGLGDGRGEYRRLLLNTQKVLRYDAFDGSPNIRNLTGGQVLFLDLTIPQYWMEQYDWVLSLEVMEHIPARYETVVLDNVARAAGEGIVLSWAPPGQSGFLHVNNRPTWYVSEVMQARGFAEDNGGGSQLQNAASLSYIKENIRIYRRQQSRRTGDIFDI